MRRGVAVLVLLASWNVAAAGKPNIDSMVPDGTQVEARVDADLNGDGLADVAFIVGNEDDRRLMLALAYREGANNVFEVNDVHTLQVTPLGPAQLEVKKGVLIVTDLTGGTTATQTVYRYRFDRELAAIRLIGIDAERYSRTNSHGTIKLSWNLLSGTHIVQEGELDESGVGDGAYRYKPEQKTTRKSQPVYVAETPDPDELLDAEVVPAGEDRD